ncbi:hypothetical protein RB5373 [Rhodopirellula baltica SH 1]|uniref:Uncharacterized protein n=1 Tax=Rhodopirellula baltica (strain DSM 10527 / NCIMB 13988 / SH1) TaxID=243090 RepID=Q7URZ0_RHOBA|nr:hypothetical protein RB5373 [Rhodopirellula baltica SH 1]
MSAVWRSPRFHYTTGANAGLRIVCYWRSDSECNFSSRVCLSSSR